MMARRIVILAAIFVVYLTINALLLLNDPKVWPDETAYADIAYNLKATGKPFTYLQRGIAHSEQKIYWYPPFLFYLLAFSHRLFGFSILAQRLLTISFGAVALILFYFLAGNFIRVRKGYQLMFLFLLLIDTTFMRATRISRPEIFIIVFSLSAFLLILKSEAFWSYLLAGVFSGLALVTQPYGLIGILTVTSYLVFRYKIKAPAKIALFLIPVFLLVVWWFWVIDFNFNLWQEAMKAQSLRKSLETGYFKQFLINPDLWNVSLNWSLLVGSLFSVVYFISKKMLKETGFLIIALSVSWLFIIYGKQFWYFVYPIPFVYLSYLMIIENEKSQAKKGLPIIYLFYVLLAVGVMTNIKEGYQVLKKYGSSDFSYELYAQSVAKEIPQHVKVFLSSIPDPYFELKKDKTLDLIQFAALPGYEKQYAESISEADYVVYNGSYEYVYGDLLIRYLKKNIESATLIDNGSNQYKGYIFKMKPKAQRTF